MDLDFLLAVFVFIKFISCSILKYKVYKWRPIDFLITMHVVQYM